MTRLESTHVLLCTMGTSVILMIIFWFIFNAIEQIINHVFSRKHNNQESPITGTFVLIFTLGGFVYALRKCLGSLERVPIQQLTSYLS